MNRVRLTTIIASLESGGRPKGGANKDTGEIWSLGAEHLDDQGGFRFENPKMIPRSFFDSLSKGIINQSDILIVKDGATTGKVSFVDSEFPFEKAAINEHLFLLRINTNRAHPKYVYHYLRSVSGQREILKDFRGATVGGISRQFSDGIDIPLPPLPEQKRIAAILDKADEIRRKREKAIELTDSFLRSVFLEMFGENSASVRSIKELLDDGTILLHKDGNFGSSYPRAEEFGQTGVPFLTARSFTDCGELIKENVQYLNEEKASTLGYGWINPDDVLLAHNATVGRVAQYRGEYERALVGTSLTIYRPNKSKLLPEYLAAALRSSIFQSQLKKNMSQTTRNQVPITAQRELKIAIPDLERQLSFYEVAHNVSLLSTRLTLSHIKANELARALSCILFTKSRASHEMDALLQEAHAL